MNLQLKSRWVGEVLVLQCAGRIVVGPEVDTLHEIVRKELEHQPHIVLQTAEVTFIDSSGLGTIVRLMSAARAAGGDVTICQCPAMMRKALTMTNLHNVFRLYETEDDAILAALQAQRPTAGAPADQSRPAVLCVDPSADVLAYLSELLKKESLRPITASNLVDSQVLMKARAPKLILANAKLSARGKTAGEIFAGCCPGVPFVDLGDAFSKDDAGEAGAKLLAQVRTLIPSNT
ncbi:MAG: STAS domain-containing protein [Acidobacteria bacterium]|nr:STAS domain-containing protein [Acidobacteriota bacterium]